MCGDYVKRPLLLTAPADTTPRVRGLPGMVISTPLSVRYNPACAGTTTDRGRGGSGCPIQPRVCGDYMTSGRTMASRIDTTPRVRGLLFGPSVAVGSRRYNPACAGTTLNFAEDMLLNQIQPRVCGDYAQSSRPRWEADDTTPRVRGLPDVIRREVDDARYNPACAGTTDANFLNGNHSPIQPRVCGDYITPVRAKSINADTTPRVRGLLVSEFLLMLILRYNPACAGTTRWQP